MRGPAFRRAAMVTAGSSRRSPASTPPNRAQACPNLALPPPSPLAISRISNNPRLHKQYRQALARLRGINATGAFLPKSMATKPGKNVSHGIFEPKRVPVIAQVSLVPLWRAVPTAAIRVMSAHQSSLKSDVREFVPPRPSSSPASAGCPEGAWRVRLVQHVSSDKKFFAVLRTSLVVVRHSL
ncbi:hypothetical protein AOQ84DRAFT_138770 [Glonium stellatum]|uniref:Uncharacterized protein n=1 Tax=Glonium stellatum TaxID=574774 RepID=A0A8E2F9J1_9PEZI|nr:hypothetical protein AOQ84DRAFT_138770 [Glonium stellatum]